MQERRRNMMMPAASPSMVAVAMVCLVFLAATAAGDMDVGDVGEYWQKRAQEARFRNQGGPLHDLVAAATRFHQDLLHRPRGGRSLLDDEARIQTTPANAEASTVEGGDDHQVAQDPAIRT